MRRPNILFFMTDDQTVRELSSYGLNDLLRTPHMDRIADEGVRFNRAFCTNALCAPARATVLTGCFSHINGITGNSERAGEEEGLREGLPTFPELLHEAGYRTGLVGKYHIRQTPRGFDHFAVHPGQGEYFDPVFIVDGERKRFTGYASDLTADLALDFLRSTPATQPFCLLCQFKAPHRPFSPAPRHRSMFTEIDVPEPATFADNYATRRIAAQSEDMRLDVSLARDYDDLPADLSPLERKRWIYQRFMKDRFRTIFGVDENVGRILDRLEATGRADDTLILFTSDHGYFLGDHGWYDKRFMYEPSIRIPLVGRAPGQRAGGQVRDELVMNVDFAPTMLDYAGLEVPEAIQGRSLRPLFEGPQPEWRQSVYYHYYEDSWRLHGASDAERAEPYRYFTPHRIGPHRGVRTERYKLIEYYSEGNYWELFDLEADPHELRNLYDDPASADIRAELKGELERLRSQYNESA